MTGERHDRKGGFRLPRIELVAALVVAVTAVGCGDSNDGGGDDAGGDSQQTAAEAQFERVDDSGGMFHVREGAGSDNLLAIVDGSGTCDRLQQGSGTPPPKLSIRTNDVEAGSYEIHSSIFAAEGSAALVTLGGLDDESRGFAYPAVGGTVELDQNASSGESLEVSVQAEFPAPLLGNGICQSRPMHGGGDAGHEEPSTTCECKRMAPEEKTFSCVPGENETSCCLGEMRYDETVTVETTVTVSRCEAPPSPGPDAVPEGGDAGSDAGS